jgi:demethylmenaquinone methyltransferase/2-methoxy-6-polyprenyl-1,4-benzoquinol methylase
MEAPTAAGTTPPGTQGERQAAQWVERMFSAIAGKYDLANHLLSFNIDRRWRKVLIGHLRPVLQQPSSRVLDLCCGTGDVVLDLGSISSAPVFGADFCHPMLVAAQNKAARKRVRALLFEGDALQLPLSENTLDAIAIAFGFRNLANYQAGLAELHRVLKPGGILALLEFSHPRGWMVRTSYGFYSRFLLPILGTIISGSHEAYAYLPDSIRKFPRAEELCNMMTLAGFDNARFQMLSGGIAALHTGSKSAAGSAR